MNYRHVFHAGNFADVFKHVALILLLRTLHNKETPFCYVDTHAGSGRYDLESVDAQRGGEYREGVARLWQATSLPDALADYVGMVRSFNPDGRLRVYPGSPLIARRLLRPQDRIQLCEREPQEAARLKAEFAGDRQTAVHERDGYDTFKALLPPSEKRGLVFVDPPYEQADEFDRLLIGLERANQRWASGMYAVWYPIKDRAAVTGFLGRLKTGKWIKVLCAELVLFPEDSAFRLNGCGLAVINPPWRFDESFAQALDGLREALSRGVATRARLDWLVQS